MIRKAPSPVPFAGGLECRPEGRAAPALVIEPTGRRFAPAMPFTTATVQIDRAKFTNGPLTSTAQSANGEPALRLTQEQAKALRKLEAGYAPAPPFQGSMPLTQEQAKALRKLEAGYAPAPPFQGSMPGGA